MRAYDIRRAACAALAVAAFSLAGCGRKQPQTVEANVSAADASAAMVENGTISDITALDATVGSSGGMTPANEAEAAPATDAAGDNGAAAATAPDNSE